MSKLKTWQELITIWWAATCDYFFTSILVQHVSSGTTAFSKKKKSSPWKYETLRRVENVSSALSSKQAEAVGPSSDMMVKFSCKCHTVYNIYEQCRFVYYWQINTEEKQTFYIVIHGFVFHFSVDALENSSRSSPSVCRSDQWLHSWLVHIRGHLQQRWNKVLWYLSSCAFNNESS